MGGSSFGQIFRVTTFGESHGVALGCVVDGCPSGLTITKEIIQTELNKRKPQNNPTSTNRNESDEVKILSGIFENKTTGTPIALLIENQNQHSADYDNIKNVYRPGHADFSYDEKFGFRDYRGGGRSSGRETCARVAAGSIAKEFLKTKGITITAYTKEACGIEVEEYDFSQIEKNFMKAPDTNAAQKMLSKIEEYKKIGNSCGGIVECVVENCPKGLGEPVFNKADALLSMAVMSIGAIKGIEFGTGFSVSKSNGKENNDPMRVNEEGNIYFESNNAGGILGGITTGEKIIFRAAVKPVPSIYMEQKSVEKNDNGYSNKTFAIQGRHDICLCPRIVPVVEAMTALTLADLYLQNTNARI